MDGLRLVQSTDMVIDHIHIFELTGHDDIFLQHHPHQLISQSTQQIHTFIIDLPIDHSQLLALLSLVDPGEIFDPLEHDSHPSQGFL